MLNENHAMWAERYRPTTLEDCVLEVLPEARQRWLLSLSHSDAPLPNLLFYGPPGTGKTTIARVLANSEKYTVIQYNGSLMGKCTVAQIEPAICTMPMIGSQRVVLIDEADGVTEAAQMALRAMMEKPMSTTSWIMTCNDRNAVVEPLLSRLIGIEVAYPTRADQPRHIEGLIRRCQWILTAEGVSEAPTEKVRSLIERHYPDVRQIVSNLQVEFQR